MGKSGVPLPEWIRNYDRSFLKSDISAGAIVAVMLVPQGMAYAMLAGLPPVIGLYAATFPLLAYALLGSSRQLAVGPVAMISLLVAAAVTPLAEPGSADYIRLVALLTLIVGVVQLTLGLLRAGFLTNFVSHAVVSGFTSAGAIIIGLSQLKHMLGIKLESGHSTIQLIAEVFGRINETHLPTLALGGVSAIIIFIFKKKWPRLPAGLFVVIISTLVVYFLGLDMASVGIVGDVPGGLPRPIAPALELTALRRLFPAAMVILFVGYMESVAVAQWIASREKYRVHPNREFAGLGAANLVAGIFSGYVVTGGFSRTAVNYQAGAKSPLASVVTAAIVIITLLFLTPLFHYLPNAVLAAIIIVAVIGLIDVKSAVELFRLKKADGWTLLVTFLITLIIGIEEGILAGVIFSLTLFVARSSHPRTAVLGYVEADDTYRDIRRYPEAATNPNMVIIRVDASLYFANARFVEDRVREELARNPDAKWVILDMTGVNDIDGEAVSTLGELMEHFAPHGVRFAFAGMKAQVRDIVQKAGWFSKLHPVTHYPTLRLAAREIQSLSQKISTDPPGDI